MSVTIENWNQVNQEQLNRDLRHCYDTIDLHKPVTSVISFLPDLNKDQSIHLFDAQDQNHKDKFLSQIKFFAHQMRLSQRRHDRFWLFMETHLKSFLALAPNVSWVDEALTELQKDHSLDWGVTSDVKRKSYLVIDAAHAWRKNLPFSLDNIHGQNMAAPNTPLIKSALREQFTSKEFADVIKNLTHHLDPEFFHPRPSQSLVTLVLGELTKFVHHHWDDFNQKHSPTRSMAVLLLSRVRFLAPDDVKDNLTTLLSHPHCDAPRVVFEARQDILRQMMTTKADQTVWFTDHRPQNSQNSDPISQIQYHDKVIPSLDFLDEVAKPFCDADRLHRQLNQQINQKFAPPLSKTTKKM